MKTTKLITITILSIIFVPFIFWNLTFGFWAGPVLALLYFFGIYYSRKRKSLKPVFTALAAGFILYIVMLPVTTYQLNMKNKKYHQIIKSGESLNVIQKSNVYGLTMLMGTVALPLFPEAAIETLLMAIPDNDKVRHFKSDFFMQSEKLQKHFKTVGGGHFTWTLKDYHFNSDEARVALTLNPLDYRIIKTDSEIIYEMRVPCHFHYGVDILIKTDFMTAAVDEYVIRHLEDEGWLFPYTAVWTHKVEI
jgi:hypothetical protein